MTNTLDIVAREFTLRIPTNGEPHEGGNSPWGQIQTVTRIAGGIWHVDTASHGGIKLSRQHNAQVPEYMRANGGWYEEDCQWSIPFVVFASQILSEGTDHSRKTINEHEHISTFRDWFPEEYEKFTGLVVLPGESHSRDADIFYCDHARDWVVTAAWGDWHSQVQKGFVGVVARIGGRHPFHGSSDAAHVEKYFLVPGAEYVIPFVVDPARHQEISPIK